MLIRNLVVAAATALAATSPAFASLVFSDDYTARANGQQIIGTSPTTPTPGVGTYQGQLTFPFGAQIDPFTPVGKALKFTTTVGSDPQALFLSWAYDGTTRLELTVRAAYETLFNTGSFNNFAIGFGAQTGPGSSWVFTDHLLVQDDSLKFFLDGMESASVPFDFSGFTYYSFVFGYDPSLAGAPGSQPFSLSINGAPIAIPALPGQVDPISSFEAVAFGSRFSPGNTNRYITDFSLSSFDVPARVPMAGTVPLVMLGAGMLGFVALGRRRC